MKQMKILLNFITLLERRQKNLDGEINSRKWVVLRCFIHQPLAGTPVICSLVFAVNGITLLEYAVVESYSKIRIIATVIMNLDNLKDRGDIVMKQQKIK